MPVIFASQDEKILVDEQDYEWLSDFAWSVSNSGYAYTRFPRIYHDDGSVTRPSKFMHRMILEHYDRLDNPEHVVHHKNEVKLDNRKENLIAVPRGWNEQASSRARGSSSYLGVSKSTKTDSKPWRSRIKVNGKQIRIGSFDSQIEAAHAYDEFAREHYGPVARTNF